MNSSDKRARGFTLIELLVVIAIISLLVTILMPSLQKAKQLARNTICCTNLSGIGKAVYYYTQEFEGTLPMQQQVKVQSATYTKGWTFWFYDLALVMGWDETWNDYMVWTKENPPIDESDPQLERPGMFFCPLTDTTVVGLGEGDWCDFTVPHPAGYYAPEHLSYGYNQDLGLYVGDNTDNDDCVWIKIEAVVRSHEKVMVGDSNNLLILDSYLSGSAADRRGLGFRHNGGANIVFVDGHVGWENPYDIQTTWTLGTLYVRADSAEGKTLLAKYWSPKAR